MSTTPNELASRATRHAHALCLKRSGDNCFGDIPLSISISMLPLGEKPGGPQGRITTRRLQIKPDVGRLLNPALVADDFYGRVCNSKNAQTEGTGAEKLFAVLRAQYEPHEPGQQHLVLRYSMCGTRDLRLIRNYLWREGYNGMPTDAMRNPLKIIDVRHALMTIAGVCRAMGTWKILPKELRDYDLDSKELTAAELCGYYRVPVPDESSESAALFRLVLAAREAEYGHSSPEATELEPSPNEFLITLGDTLDYLEGVVGIPPSPNTVSSPIKRARQLLPPADHKVELTPSNVSLLLHNGKWLPVVQPMFSDRQDGTDRCLLSLPEGRLLHRPAHISAPLVPLDLLAPKSGWAAAADERLRRICGRDGEALNFQSLRESFAQTAGGWRLPEPNLTPLPLPTSNAWTQFHNFPPNTEQYAIAGKAAFAINRRDAEGAQIALDQLAAHAVKGGPNKRRAAQILLHNLRLTASRADLLNDGRKAWLRQMALLSDPEAWPEDLSVNAHYFTCILYGDGQVAQHNRIAVASRSAWGIPASKAALAVVSQPPLDPERGPSEARPGLLRLG